MEPGTTYVIKLHELLWGGFLLALTIAIHGFGMLLVLRVTTALRERYRELRARYLAVGLAIVILASWMIILVNLIEVLGWTLFFVAVGAQPDHSSAFYNALLNYTTLQAGYLPTKWRLLEGMLGMSGLLTFAWSTSVLFSLAQEFQETALQRLQRRMQSAGSEHLAKPDGGPLN